MLDLGCFDGMLLDEAERAGFEGWGVELQASAAAQAAEGRGNRVSPSRLEDYCPPAGVEFDLVTAVAVVEHLRDPAVLFRIAGEALRPGGTLVVQTPNLRSFPARLMGRFWPPVAAPEHIYYFDRKTLAAFALQLGFVTFKVRPNIKHMPIRVTYDRMRHFGPELRRVVGPVVERLPEAVLDRSVPLYGGEMLLAARKL